MFRAWVQLNIAELTPVVCGGRKSGVGSRIAVFRESQRALDMRRWRTGSYLGEDDIIRIEDGYRRS
jgi:hypothetical protein